MRCRSTAAPRARYGRGSGRSCRRAATTRPSSTRRRLTTCRTMWSHSARAIRSKSWLTRSTPLRCGFRMGTPCFNAIPRRAGEAQAEGAGRVRCWPHHLRHGLADPSSVATARSAPASAPATNSATSRISISRFIPSPTSRRCRCCRRSATGIRTNSSRRWRRRTRLSPRSTSRATSRASSTSRSTRRSKLSPSLGRLGGSR